MKIFVTSLAALLLLHVTTAIEKPQSLVPNDEQTLKNKVRKLQSNCQQALAICEATLDSIDVDSVLDSSVVIADHKSKSHSSDEDDTDEMDVMKGWPKLFFLNGALQPVLEAIFYMSGSDVKLTPLGTGILVGVPAIIIAYRLIIRRLFPQLLLPNIFKFLSQLEIKNPFLEGILETDDPSLAALNTTNTTLPVNGTDPQETLEEFREVLAQAITNRTLPEKVHAIIGRLDEIIFFLEPNDIVLIMDLLFHFDPVQSGDKNDAIVALVTIPIVVLALHLVIRRLFPQLLLTNLFPFLRFYGNDVDFFDATMDELRIVLSDSIDRGDLDPNMDKELLDYIFFLELPKNRLFGKDKFDDDAGRKLGLQATSTVIKLAMNGIYRDLPAEETAAVDEAIVEANHGIHEAVLEPIAKVIFFLSPGIDLPGKLGIDPSTAALLTIPALFAAVQITLRRLFPQFLLSNLFPILRPREGGDRESETDTCLADLEACTTTLGTAQGLMELADIET